MSGPVDRRPGLAAPPAEDVTRTPVPRLLVLTDRRQLPPGHDLVDRLALCARGGATHVVLRELDLPARRRARLAARVADLGLTVIAARSPLPRAPGLHLPGDAQDPPRSSVPAPRPGARPQPLGRSCHTPAEVDAAACAGVDYVTLGPLAPTPSKPGHLPRLGEEEWRRTCARAQVPVLALGGVTTRFDAARARDLGAHGVAVMGALMRSRTPAHLAHDLLEALR